MKCKKCEAELEEGVTLCPGCGFDNSADAAEQTPAEETPCAAECCAAEESCGVEPAEAQTPVEEAPAEEPAAQEPQQPKMGFGKIALLVILGIAAVAVVVALIAGGMNSGDEAEPTVPGAEPIATTEATIPADGNPDDVTCKGSYSVSDEEIAAAADTVVATLGDAQLTNGDLQIYYWMQFYDFMEMYGNYVTGMGLNPIQALDTQKSIEEGLTWQQFMLKGALENWTNYTSLRLKAQEEGYEIQDDYLKFLEEMPKNLQASAESYGYESAEQMIQADMGKGASLAAYTGYMETYYRGYQYYSAQLEKLELTDAMLEEYYEAHKDEYAAKGMTEDTRFVDVRHILIQPKGGSVDEAGKTVFSEEEWAAAEAEAQKVLTEYLAGEQTAERFAELAEKYSQDPGSRNNGGLYTDVYVGQMVKPFEDWCFDASRAVGDTGIVKTDYGFHVMFFVESRPAWIQSARTDLMADKGQGILEDIRGQYELNVDYSAIDLGVVDMKMG